MRTHEKYIVVCHVCRRHLEVPLVASEGSEHDDIVARMLLLPW